MHANDPRAPQVYEPSVRGTWYCWSVATLFCVWIALPPLSAAWVDEAGWIEQNEQRLRAAFPALEFRPGRWRPSTRSVLAVPQGFERWFGDRLGLRRWFIQAYNAAQVAGLVRWQPAVGQENRATVVVGREGWLFLGGPEAVADFRRTQPFREEELSAWCELFAARQAWLSARGIRYLVVVAPSKHTIYGEFMPRALDRVGAESRMDQLLARLRAAGIATVDTRPALTAAREVLPTYMTTDTHWTDFGALVACREIAARMQADFPEWRPPELEWFEPAPTTGFGDLARMLGSPASYRETYVELQPRRPSTCHPLPTTLTSDGLQVRHWTNPHAELDGVLVTGDSFCEKLAPRIVESWRRGAQVVGWKSFPLEVIEAHRPQLVVQETLELHLMGPPPENPPELHAGSATPWARRTGGAASPR